MFLKSLYLFYQMFDLLLDFHFKHQDQADKNCKKEGHLTQHINTHFSIQTGCLLCHLRIVIMCNKWSLIKSRLLLHTYSCIKSSSNKEGVCGTISSCRTSKELFASLAVVEHLNVTGVKLQSLSWSYSWKRRCHSRNVLCHTSHQLLLVWGFYQR